ncbi:MAG: hypothetical protein KDD77_14010, partial [Caldilineaceae bacterium]|nr:hypothetical protein [Caldilineaceae bacterium]
MLLGLWAAVAAHAPDDTPGEPGRALRSGMANVAAGAVSAAVGVANPGFHATRAADGYAVANQAQEFAATLDQNGFLVSAGATSWGLRLTAIGRGNDLAAAGAATLHAAGNRVEVRRNALTAWYVNG